MSAGENHRMNGIKSTLRIVPDFPKPGIMFLDITTLLLDPKAFKDTIDLFVERYKHNNVSVVAGSGCYWRGSGLLLGSNEYERLKVAFFEYYTKEASIGLFDNIPIWGIEARGFMFGPAIALAIGAKFVPLRKPKKLPGEVISEKYVLEYGADCLEMHVGAVQPGERALVVDDLVATGGTLCAAMNLLERAGAVVVECACVIEVPELKGRELLQLHGKPLYVLVESQFQPPS